jgi:hypothetical protein
MRDLPHASITGVIDMRARFALAFSLVLMLILTVLMSPASGQTAISPEATPEFWPLTFDPATVKVDPEKPTLVFESQYRCSLTSDDKAVVVQGVGVYDLSTGEKRFDFEESAGRVDISYRLPRVFVRNKGLYDVNTGELLVETASPDAFLSPYGDYMIDGPTVYDAATGDVLYRAAEDVTSLRADPWFVDRRWVSITYQLADTVGQPQYEWVIVDAETGAPPAGQFAFMSNIVEHRATSVRDGSLVAISGDGLYEVATGEKRFALEEMQDLRLSLDGEVLIAITADNELQLIDTQTGEVILRREDVPFIPAFGRGDARVGGFVLSPDNTTLLVPEYSEVRSGGTSSYLTLGAQLVDVATDQVVGSLPAAGEYAFPWDGRYVQLVGQGVFDVATGQMVFETAEPFIRVMPNGRFALVRDNGVLKIFDPKTWTLLYEIPGGITFVGLDYDWMLGVHGLYNVESGQLEFPLDLERPGISFTGRYVIGNGESRCSIYRLPEAEE